ncbi:AT-hook motif nuclear-localized protein 28-like [Cicer arietinum]|uniref:AT-hook motif nuclear-localized protein 28-like n=1 Tax=Cicer arietinum TaxID=3827 RepID=A0A3Q7YCH8_CICAR|nr:AT-hook motif nuclear-localized protein 28-like [Cicer arietinum]
MNLSVSVCHICELRTPLCANQRRHLVFTWIPSSPTSLSLSLSLSLNIHSTFTFFSILFSSLFFAIHIQQTMFSNFQHNNLFQPSRECQTSEDDDARSSGGPNPITTQNPFSGRSAASDGASIEIGRRPRGRPPGSKNKPKSPLIITNDPEPAMSPHILEIPGGSDLVESIARFSNRRNTGLCVLTGSGTVVNVTLRQPSAPLGTTVTFTGRFNILTISATFFPSSESSPPMPKEFSISLAGPQGQIIGGFVVGRLVAAGTVFVIAASFNNPSYHRLPLEEDVRSKSVSGGDGQSPSLSGGESCMYSCQLPSDVIWAPTARTPF